MFFFYLRHFDISNMISQNLKKYVPDYIYCKALRFKNIIPFLTDLLVYVMKI